MVNKVRWGCIELEFEIFSRLCLKWDFRKLNNKKVAKEQGIEE